MRYGITEADGGASAQTGLPVDTKSFRLQLLELYSQIMPMIGLAAAGTALANLKTQLSNLSADAIEGLWPTAVYPQIEQMPKFTLLQGSSNNTIGEAIRAQTAIFSASGVLTYEYD